MKNKRKNFGIKMLFLLFLVGGITACDVSDDNANNSPQYVYVATTGVTGPVTATVNQEIILNVSFKVDSDCGTFYSFFEEGITTTERTITVLAQYFGKNCEELPITRSAPYIFKASAAGTYVLKFKVDNLGTSTSFITQTIVVS